MQALVWRMLGLIERQFWVFWRQYLVIRSPVWRWWVWHVWRAAWSPWDRAIRMWRPRSCRRWWRSLRPNFTTRTLGSCLWDWVCAIWVSSLLPAVHACCVAVFRDWYQLARSQNVATSTAIPEDPKSSVLWSENLYRTHTSSDNCFSFSFLSCMWVVGWVAHIDVIK